MCDDCRLPLNRTRRSVLGAVGLPVMLSVWRAAARQRDLPPPVEVAEGLRIIPRAGWAEAMPQLWAPGGEDVKFLLVHHTAGSNDDSEDGVVDHIRSAYRLHTGPEKGWPDVCYNFFIDRFGRVWEGRAGSLEGAVMVDATGGSQGFAQLVCLLGDFTEVMPSDSAVDALKRTLAWLANRHGLDTTPGSTTEFISRGSNKWPAGQTVKAAIISGHRDMSSTACPGDTFYPYVHDSLQVDVQALRAAEPSASTAPPTSAAPASTLPPIAPTDPPTTAGPVVSSTSVALTDSSPSTSAAGQPPVRSSSHGRSGVLVAGTALAAGSAGVAAWVFWRRLRAGQASRPPHVDVRGAAELEASPTVDPLLQQSIDRSSVDGIGGENRLDGLDT